MARQLPSSLREKQDRIRIETENKIQNAIDTLKSIGYGEITIVQIMNETNLARSTLNKPHCQEILKKNSIGKYRSLQTINKEKSSLNEKELIGKLEKQLAIANSKIITLEKRLDDANAKMKDHKIKAYEAKEELRHTAGNFQALYEKILALGIEIII